MLKEKIKKIIAVIKKVWDENGFTDGAVLAAAAAAFFLGAKLAVIVGLVCFWAGANKEKIRVALKELKKEQTEG